MRDTRPISWIKAALKEYQRFPATVQTRAELALTIVAEGGTPEIAKPLTGIDANAWELKLNERAGTFRVVYALKVGAAIYIVHAFQKKSKSGIATPKAEIDLIKQRIKDLKEALNDQ